MGESGLSMLRMILTRCNPAIEMALRYGDAIARNECNYAVINPVRDEAGADQLFQSTKLRSRVVDDKFFAGRECDQHCGETYSGENVAEGEKDVDKPDDTLTNAHQPGIVTIQIEAHCDGRLQPPDVLLSVSSSFLTWKLAHPSTLLFHMSLVRLRYPPAL